MKWLSRHFPLVTFLAAELLFLSYKLAGLSFRLGDTNAYWFMAHKITDGVLPYRDFFLADPPMYVLFLVPFVALFRSELLVVQLVPALLEMVAAAGVFFFLKREKVQFYWLAPAFYLLSFTILATSDYGTGLQLATALYVTALLFWQRKKYWVMGGFLALACLTKLYMVPAIVGLLLFFILKKQYKTLFKVAGGGLVTASVVLLPFLLMSPSAFIADVITHHFFRPSGTSKLEVFSFLLVHEAVFIVLATIGIYLKKKYILVLPFFMQFAFFLFFRDVYYAYLGSLIPYFVILSCFLLSYLWQKSQNYQRVTEMTLVLTLFLLIYGSYFYWRDIHPMGKFKTEAQWTKTITQLPEQYDLYGSHELAPLLALRSEKEIFNTTIDTNTQTFASGAHKIEEVSQAAAERGIYLIAKTYTHPQTLESIYIYSGFFSEAIFEKHCQLITEDPLGDNIAEKAALFKCKT